MIINNINLTVFIAAIVSILFVGCAATEPGTKAEMFPAFNQDPELGIIIVEGTPAINVNFYDQSGRIVERWTERGTNPAFTLNGRTRVRIYKYRLPQGRYRVEIQPFYYASNIVRRRLVELRKKSARVTVDNKARDSYDRKYTKKYWGWVLKINSGRVPRSHFQSPTVDISGTGPFKILFEVLFNQLGRLRERYYARGL